MSLTVPVDRVGARSARAGCGPRPCRPRRCRCSSPRRRPPPPRVRERGERRPASPSPSRARARRTRSRDPPRTRGRALPPTSPPAKRQRRSTVFTPGGLRRLARRRRGDRARSRRCSAGRGRPGSCGRSRCRTDALMPAANTVTKTTTARPIISAPAVTAVRPGLRTVFSRASRPVRPRSLSSGQPTDGGERAHEPRAEHRDAEQRGHRPAARPAPAAAFASSVAPNRPAQVIPIPSEDSSSGERREDPARACGSRAARPPAAPPWA